MGSALSRAVHIDDKATARTAKPECHLEDFTPNGIRLDTKLIVYKAVVLPTLLYACETRTVYQRRAKRPFAHMLPEKILRIRWQNKTPGIEVLKKAMMQSVHTLSKLHS